MKVTNLRRKLAAALVAGGMLSPAAAMAADLDTNLVVNGDFENVDNTVTGAYNSVLINDWTHSGSGAFAYSHDGSLTSGGDPIGDYANGSPLAGGGSFYFTPGSNSAAESFADALKQDIDVSTGASATLIQSGNAAFSLSAVFSSFSTQADHGIIDVEFLDNGGGNLGTTVQLTAGENLSAWTAFSTAGIIPVGTETVRVSSSGSPVGGGSSDGYTDNIDFQVTDEVILSALDLRVDRDDGSLILTNQTGSPVNISGYQITSPFEGLDPANWVSIANTYDGDSGGAVDGTNDWSELTQAGAHGDLSEGDLESGNGGSLAHTQSINLGNAGTWIRNPNENLVFQYISNGNTLTGIVNFEDAEPYVSGDVNTDGDIDLVDWGIVRSNQHADLSDESLAEAYRLGDLTGDGLNNHADFAAFKTAFDGMNGAGSFVAMLSASSAVPEPASVVLVLSAGLLVWPVCRRAVQQT